jgi:hypothetical protein
MPKARNIPRRRLLFPIVPVWGDVFRVESSAAEVKERIEAIVRHLAGIQEREAWRNIQRASAGNSPADRDVVRVFSRHPPCAASLALVRDMPSR